MKQGQIAEDAVFSGDQPQQVDHRIHIGIDIMVRENDSLRFSGRPAGKENGGSPPHIISGDG